MNILGWKISKEIIYVLNKDSQSKESHIPVEVAMATKDNIMVWITPEDNLRVQNLGGSFCTCIPMNVIHSLEMLEGETMIKDAEKDQQGR